jgi:Kef-type K+ transport system membrane component KefB
MMHLTLQLGIILLASKFMGWFFSRKLKQSKVLGELIAGMIIGPYMLGALPLGSFGPMFPPVSGPIPVSVELYGFATIGSIFLLFSSGLETDLPTFIKFSGKASLVGFGGVIASFFLGAGLTVLLVPTVTSIMDAEALFLGTICTATSIGITARILNEKKKISTPEGVTILAAAVLDDVISIILLSIVVGIASMEEHGGVIAWSSIGMVAGKAIGFWLLCMVAGILLAPHITKGLKRFDSLELLAELTFGLALLLAGLSEMAGLAMIIGAYIMGLALSQTDVSFEISERINVVGDYFVSMFFAVMGMMVDFAMIKPVLGFGIVFAIVAFLGKLLGCGIPALFAGFNLRGAFRVGAGMLPRGEVTLIVAGIGLASGAIGEDMFGVAVVTMFLASVAAPPLVVFAFKGGSGYKKSLVVPEKEDIVTIELEFPSARAADFVRRSIAEGYHAEGFFIKRLEGTVRAWQIRKESMVFTMKLLDSRLEMTCTRDNEEFVRLMLTETLVDFQNFIEGIKAMDSPDKIGANLLIAMFAEEDSKTKTAR